MFGPLSRDPLSTVLDIAKFVGGGEAKKRKNSPDYGDVIYVQRIGYKHFGIYVGNRRVIHYAHDRNGRLCIHEAPIEEFLDGEIKFYSCDFPQEYGSPTPVKIASFAAMPQYSLLAAWIRSHKSSKYHLYSPAETVKRARQKLGEEEYNLVTNNCEHFALWCKTGLHESHQVNEVIEMITNIPIGG